MNRSNRSFCALALCAISVATSNTPAAPLPQPYFTLIPGLPGDNPVGSRSFGISGDGSTVFGGVRTTGVWEAMTWTRNGGTVAHGAGAFLDASHDGNLLVGSGPGNGVKWSSSTGWQALGTGMTGVAVSADGVNVAAQSSSSRAHRWTPSTGIQALPSPGFATSPTYPAGISDDGNVVVSNISEGFLAPYKWTPAGGSQYFQPHGSLSIVTDVSGDGNTVLFGGPSDMSGLLYTPSGPVALPMMPNSTRGSATDMSRNALFVVGTNHRVAGTLPIVDAAYIWDATHGTRNIESLLNSCGIDTGTFHLSEATGVSEDGMYLTGTGYNVTTGLEQAWFAVIPAPSTSGILLLTTGVFTTRRRRNATK